jgi:hypothetical protein
MIFLVSHHYGVLTIESASMTIEPLSEARGCEKDNNVHEFCIRVDPGELLGAVYLFIV